MKGQGGKGENTSLAIGIRADLGSIAPYLDAIAKSELGGGSRLAQAQESFAGKGTQIPFVAWLDESIETALVKGNREGSLLSVARIPDPVREKWRSAFARSFEFPEKVGFGTLVGVVFPDGRIAVGASRLREDGISGSHSITSPAHVIDAACSTLKLGECKPIMHQPFLAAFELTFDPATGAITNIRDVFRPTSGQKQYWVKEWGAALEASLFIHGLALHNELQHVRFPEDTRVLDCHAL
jgi:hypothetical protein